MKIGGIWKLSTEIENFGAEDYYVDTAGKNASNNLFVSVRPYLEAASSTGLRPLKKYPQLGWGMFIWKIFLIKT